MIFSTCELQTDRSVWYSFNKSIWGSINILAWAGIMFLLSFLNIYPIIIIGFVLIRIERSNCENIMHDVIWTWKRVFGKIEGFLWIISEKAFPKHLTASMLYNCGFSETRELYFFTFRFFLNFCDIGFFAINISADIHQTATILKTSVFLNDKKAWLLKTISLS